VPARQEDFVARQTDEALDVIKTWIRRIAKHHHVAALRRSDIENFLVNDRQSQTVFVLVDQDQIADEQRWKHRPGGNSEGFGNEGSQQKDDKENRKQSGRVIYPPGIKLLRIAPWRPNPSIQGPHRSGE